MRGCGVVAWCAVMATVFLCRLCGSSDAVMASVPRHQAHRHIARGGRHTGPYNRPAGASVGRMCKGSGIKHVVHTLPSGVQRGRTVVSWALAERHQSLHTRPCAQQPRSSLLLVLALQWRTLVLKTLGRGTWTCRTPLRQRVLWCTRSRTVVWNLLTLCSPCASLTTRSCRRVYCTESRGMRLTVLRSTSSTNIWKGALTSWVTCCQLHMDA